MKRRGKIFRLLVGGILLAFFMCPFNANAQGISKAVKVNPSTFRLPPVKQNPTTTFRLPPVKQNLTTKLTTPVPTTKQPKAPQIWEHNQSVFGTVKKPTSNYRQSLQSSLYNKLSPDLYDNHPNSSHSPSSSITPQPEAGSLEKDSKLFNIDEKQIDELLRSIDVDLQKFDPTIFDNSFDLNIAVILYIINNDLKVCDYA